MIISISLPSFLISFQYRVVMFNLQIVFLHFGIPCNFFFFLTLGHNVLVHVAVSAYKSLFWEAVTPCICLSVPQPGFSSFPFVLLSSPFLQKSLFFSLFSFLLVIRTEWWLTSSWYLAVNGFSFLFPDHILRLILFFSAFESLMKNFKSACSIIKNKKQKNRKL